MRIALVCPYDLGRFGGVQGQALQLVSWLRAEGHDAWVVGPGLGPEGTVSVGEVTVVNANGSRTPIALGLRTRRRVLAAVSGADVVHIHEPMMPLASLTATLGVRVASVGTFHADAPRGVAAAYRRMFGLSGGRVGRLDVVTAVSPVAAVPLKGVVAHRIVPNGLDVASYPEPDRVPGRVAFLGRDDPRKGLDVFVAAAVAVSGRHPGASFVAAGTDEPGARGPVRLAGRAGEEEKRRFLSEAEVFVAPHRGGESFGLVLAEAMAAGCAVVASGLPAFAHVLGDAGILVPPGDAAATADAVSMLLADDAARRALQHAARERVARFDRSVVLDGYLAAYADAAGS